MKVGLALSLALLPATLACASLHQTSHSLGDQNLRTLASIQPGTPRAELLTRMESRDVRIKEGRHSRPFWIPNPHHSALIVLQSGEPAEVFYYYTGTMLDDGIAATDELTPVVVSSGAFAGAGWDFLEQQALPAALAEARRKEMEREIQAARRLESQAPGWDPLEQEFREELGRASTLIRMIQLPSYGF